MRVPAYHVSRQLADGHICIDIDKINAAVKKGAYENEDVPEQYCRIIEPESLRNNPRVLKTPSEEFPAAPFIIDENRFYLQRYWVYETNIIRFITKALRTSQKKRATLFESLSTNTKYIQKIFPTLDAQKIEWQLVAVLASCLNSFSIITGGPGTGKTYTVAKLLALLLKIDNDEKIVMAAPTGKAAARLKESLDREIKNLPLAEQIRETLEAVDALTIHSLLGFVRGTHRFKHHREQPLQYSTIVVDEASMVDAALMSKLFDAVGEGARIILLGDKNQLASVEAGSIFGDLCRAAKSAMDTGPEVLAETAELYEKITGTGDLRSLMAQTKCLSGTVTELKESRRFSDDQGIGKFSKAIITGRTAVLKEKEYRFDTNDLFQQVRITHDAPWCRSLYKKYFEYIETTDIETALDRFDSFRILCATRGDEYGLETINYNVETYLGLNKDKKLFYHNQPLMITRNDPQLDMFNGDIGIVRQGPDGKLNLYLKNRPGIPVALLSQYETAFALTIHKSQGSDYDSVLVYLPLTKSRVLSRELLYTAVTRAKQDVTVFGSEDIIDTSIRKAVARASGIESRLSAATLSRENNP